MRCLARAGGLRREITVDAPDFAACACPRRQLSLPPRELEALLLERLRRRAVRRLPPLTPVMLYALVIVRLARRELVWINVTAHPTAEWIAQQITEAFPWDQAPRYLIRDRDAVYGAVVTRRLRAMGIRDKPISAGSPWQNGFAERLIGTIRRKCVDHLVCSGGTPASGPHQVRRLL